MLFLLRHSDPCSTGKGGRGGGRGGGGLKGGRVFNFISQGR